MNNSEIDDRLATLLRDLDRPADPDRAFAQRLEAALVGSARAGTQLSSPNTTRPDLRRVRISGPWLGLAAAILVLLVLGVPSLLSRQTPSTTSVLQFSGPPVPSAEAPTTTTTQATTTTGSAHAFPTDSLEASDWPVHQTLPFDLPRNTHSPGSPVQLTFPDGSIASLVLPITLRAVSDPTVSITFRIAYQGVSRQVEFVRGPTSSWFGELAPSRIISEKPYVAVYQRSQDPAGLFLVREEQGWILRQWDSDPRNQSPTEGELHSWVRDISIDKAASGFPTLRADDSIKLVTLDESPRPSIDIATDSWWISVIEDGCRGQQPGIQVDDTGKLASRCFPTTNDEVIVSSPQASTLISEFELSDET